MCINCFIINTWKGFFSLPFHPLVVVPNHNLEMVHWAKYIHERRAHWNESFSKCPCNLIELPNIHVLANLENASIHELSQCWNEKDASIQHYVPTTKMFSYPTKDLRLAHLLDWVEKNYGFWLLDLHSKYVAIPPSLMDPP
jgi:hypothetical protein